MTKTLLPLHIRTHVVIKLTVLGSQATAIYSLSTLTRCFKDLKTKCTKAGKEIPKKTGGGKKGKLCSQPPGGFKVS